jgi:hypothetical protein
MSQTPSILGQNFPDAGVDTNLFTVSVANQAQFSVFLANHEMEIDRITIALIPNGGSETSANYIAYNTPVIGNAVMAFSGLFLNSGDRVQILSENGTTSFTATGVLTAP